MEQLRSNIALSMLKGIGPILAKNLVAYLGSSEAVFKEKALTLSKIPEIGKVLSEKIISQHDDAFKRADKEIEFIQKNNIKALFYADEEYPYRLRECEDSPIVLYVLGNADLSNTKMLSMVGTRKATDYGKNLCDNFVREIACLVPNSTIISGLAYGIDIAAHRAALKHQIPTIAVLAHGLDRIYPEFHRDTAKKIIEDGGALLTEYPSGTKMDRSYFVQRNRIVAGLSDAVVVVESAKKGGSLITTEAALAYNRDIFAFPGRVGDESSEGCNDLISHLKAGLITSAKDLARLMNWSIDEKKQKVVQPKLFDNLSLEQETIVSFLRKKKESVHIDEISLETNIPIYKMQHIVYQLNEKGILALKPGNMYQLNF
ncbi:MAG: DNA-processing protein DprA [Paludibacteraceae bacterium]|nr:DNA-processing protein DprA [Paludibacteraceae bacterium]